MRSLPPLALALLFVAPTSAAGAQDAPTERPNLVLIYTDDQRHDSLSATGNPYFETPSLDRIAREGVLFERAYATTSLCCPGRASVLTGKYAHVTCVWDNQPERDFLESHRTLADLLQDAGYETAFLGKWHLPNPGAAPRRGFDRWVSFEDQGEYFDEVMNVDGERVRTHGSNADVLADYAVEFVESERERPFFLFLSLKNCHNPHLPPARLRGALDGVELRLPESFTDPLDSLPTVYREARLNRRNRGAHPHPDLYLLQVQRYYELVLQVDEVAGRVLDALEARGILDRTAVVFTSDNGYMHGEHGLIQKGVAYEPSIRVPLALRYPPRLPAGRRSDALALNVDLMPTFLELAGVTVPSDTQGRSLVAAARGEAAREPEDFLYIAPWFTDRRAPTELALAGGRWKYVRFRIFGGEEVLFDLESEARERENLAADPAFASQLERCRARLREHMRALDVPDAWWEPE